VEEVCREIADLIGRFCGGSLSHGILSKDNPTMSLTCTVRV
jgi:hypothetical protein